MKIQEIINGFLKGKWMNEAKSFINNPQKMKALGESVGKMVNEKGLKEIKEKLLLLKNYVVDIATGKYKDYQVSSLLIVIAGLIYVVTPVDLIPDFLPVIGWTDDVAVITWVFGEISDELERYRLWRLGLTRY